MSIIGSNILAGASGQAGGGGAYEISRSVRFNSADSAYLSRTPASAGNRRTWTWAGWVKRSELGNQTIFEASPGGDFYTLFWFTSSDQIQLLGDEGAGPVTIGETSAAVFRDVSAWMHVLLAVDTSQASASSRVRLYINGIEATLTKSLSPSLNYDTYVNSANAHAIAGGARAGMPYFSGYLADIHFIDGQALDPSSFGEFDTNGVWQPIDASELTYGTNGFHLPFSDNSTAAALGTDTSSNGNDWTVNNISVTAGAGNDSLVDSPTNGSQTDTGVGGEVVGNYATLNPLDNPGNTLSNGNLDLVGLSNSFHGVRSTIGQSTGKWYFECTIVAEGGETRTGPGLYRPTDVLAGDYGNGTVVVFDYLGVLYVSDESGAGSTWYSTSGTVSAGDIFGFAFDLDAQKVWIHQNGTWLNSGNPGAGTGAVVSSLPTGTYFPGGWAYNTSDNLVFNFGQRAFAYNSNRSGFKALCDTNLPAPVVAKPSTVMDVLLYTGNGSTQTISGLNFSPDLVWIKGRSGATDHALYDTVRGVQQQLESNTTTDETTESTGLTAFNSDGFALGALAQANTSSATYAAWCWNESVSAGFDIVTYTGNGSARTIAHSLGVAPSMIIVKARTTASTDQGWPVYHSANTAAPETDYLLLNDTAATADLDTVWNDTAPTSSVFSVGTNALVNANADTYVAYLFSAVVGYSSFGSYTGNGSADGPFVFCGFRPRWILIKQTNTGRDWRIYDTSRNAYNLVDLELYPNAPNAEATANGMDLLSNGFKFRSSGVGVNTSGGTYIYAAFAEHPFAYARAR
jgi:hypothetical protein